MVTLVVGKDKFTNSPFPENGAKPAIIRLEWIQPGKALSIVFDCKGYKFHTKTAIKILVDSEELSGIISAVAGDHLTVMIEQPKK